MAPLTELSFKKRKKAHLIKSELIFLFPLFFVGIFFFLPLLLVLQDAFTKDGNLTFTNLVDALQNPLNIHFARFTINQALISAIITMILGLPIALILARIKLPKERLLKNLMTIPFVLPPIVVVLGFILLIGPQGIINSFLIDIFNLSEPPIKIYQTFQGIIIVHAFYNIPIVIRLVSSSLERINPDIEDVARSLGSNGYNFFKNIILPRISSSWLASGVLTFLYCFTSFAIIISLGGIKYKTLEARIFALFYYSYNYEMAAALAVLQLLITSIVIIVYVFLTEGEVITRNIEMWDKNHRRKIIVVITEILIMVIGLTAIIVQDKTRVITLIIIVLFLLTTKLREVRSFSAKYDYFTKKNSYIAPLLLMIALILSRVILFILIVKNISSVLLNMGYLLGYFSVELLVAGIILLDIFSLDTVRKKRKNYSYGLDFLFFSSLYGWLKMLLVDSILGVIILVTGIIYLRWGRITSESLTDISINDKKMSINDLYKKSKGFFLLVVFVLIIMTFFLLSPIVIIFIMSFYDRYSGKWGIDGYLSLFGLTIVDNGLSFKPESIPVLGANVTPFNILINSLAFSLLTLIVSVILAMTIVYSIKRSSLIKSHRKITTMVTWLFLLPLATSSITLGLGMLRFFSLFPLKSSDSWLPIVIAHVLAAYPFVTRSINTAYDNLPSDMIDVSASLGASPWEVFRRIELPIILPGIISGAIFSIAISMGEFGATYFIARSEYITLTIGVYKFLEVRQFQLSSVMSSILIMVCIFAFLAVQRFFDWDFRF